jgi:hypothetical protein
MVTRGEIRRSGSFIRQAALKLCLLPLVLAASTQTLSAQQFSVLHNFTGPDGNVPWQGLVFGPGGGLYGATQYGGLGHGNVYRLTQTNGTWTAASLYNFTFTGVKGISRRVP